MGSSCCKNSKNDDKPPLPAAEIAPKESGPIDSTHPPLDSQKLTESSGKSLKQNEMGKSARNPKSSSKISLKKSGPIDSDGIPNKTEIKTGSNSEQFDQVLSRAFSKFACDLYSKIEKDRIVIGSNPFTTLISRGVVYSPLSITSALALVEHGASGKTREEILKLISPKPALNNSCIPVIDCAQQYGGLQDKVLQFPIEHGQLFIANSVFLDTDYSIAIKESYLQNVQICFKTETIKAPFEKDTEQARQQVNQWISKKTVGMISEFFRADSLKKETEKTKERIPEFLGPFSLAKETAVVLVNTIYMKVEWECKFDVGETRERTFYPQNGFWKKAKFMCGDGRCVAMYMDRKDFHAVELPCKGGTMSIYIILPHDRYGIRELEKKINSEFLINVLKNTQSDFGHVDLHVEIPKFTMGFKSSMLPSLAELDFLILHELERMVDRSRIPDNRRTFKINDIIHDADIKVDEKGWEAATVSVVDVTASTAWNDKPAASLATVATESTDREPPMINFVADHPFLFVIAHRPTLSVVLMGNVESVDL